MKEIENIFSKAPTKKEENCPNPNTQIIIDTREKQSLIAANLKEQKASTTFEKLEIGDYLINETILERKTFSDFVNSMLNKRLISQLIEMQKYENKYLILEGFNYDYSKFNINENAIRGMLLSIPSSFKIPIIYTKDEEDTSKFLITLAKRQSKEKKEFSIRQTKTAMSPEKQKQFILEGFPGIGPIAAKKLLTEFSSLKNIFNATSSDFEKIKLNSDKIKKFFSILN